MLQFQARLNADEQKNAASVVASIESLRKKIAKALDSMDPRSGTKDLESAQDALRQLNSKFQEPSSERTLGENLLAHAALSAIHDASSTSNRLILQKYADPAQGYARREEVSRALRQVPLAENLKLEGFRQIGESPFYRKFQFVVGTEQGVPILYVPFDAIAQRGEIAGARGVSESGKPGLTIVSRDAHGYSQSSYYDGGSSSGGSAAWTLGYIRTTSVETQLAEARFVRDERYPNVYRLQDPHFGSLRGKIPELIAVVSNDKIETILKAVLPYVQDKINENTRIAGYGDVPSRIQIRNETDPAVTLTNERIEFKVDAHGSIVDGSQYLFREVSLAEVKVKPVDEQREASGFVIGGSNATATIRRLPSINGIAISELEKVMRPGKSSHAGFLNESQSLLEVLAIDNDYVLAQGLTHRELATHLKYAMGIYRQGYGHEFQYHGTPFKIDCTSWMGSQESPFNDGMRASSDYRLTNLRTGKKIAFSGLIPEMVERYGFYEGNSTYRLDPRNIVEILDFLKK